MNPATDTRIGRMARLTLRRAGKGLPWQPESRQLFILPTRGGVILGTALLFMLLGSLNYNNNLAIALTFFLGALFVISAVLANQHLKACRLLQLNSLPAHAGERLHVQLFWQTPDPHFLPAVEAANASIQLQATSLTLTLPTRHRGWLKLPPLKLTSRYPLGLFEAWTWWQYPRPLLIWPAAEPNPPPLPGNPLENRASGLQRPEGELTELHRWQAGEPLSRVAWKIVARHGQWLARSAEPETERQGPIRLRPQDTGLQETEAMIARLTAWVLEAERQGIPYSLQLDHGPGMEPGLGEAHLARCMEWLALA